jgi:hypothetical protein
MGNDIEMSELLLFAAFLPLFQITYDKDNNNLMKLIKDSKIVGKIVLLHCEISLQGMNENKLFEQQLLNRNIKPTAIRLLILKAIAEKNDVVSLVDLETMLETVDKSTVFRTLTLFQQNHLLHTIDDGSTKKLFYRKYKLRY